MNKVDRILDGEDVEDIIAEVEIGDLQISLGREFDKLREKTNAVDRERDKAIKFLERGKATGDITEDHLKTYVKNAKAAKKEFGKVSTAVKALRASREIYDVFKV